MLASEWAPELRRRAAVAPVQAAVALAPPGEVPRLAPGYEPARDQRLGDVRRRARCLSVWPAALMRDRLRRAGIAQLLQLGQHRVQALALDELHHIIMRSLMLADAEDRHDVGVVQPRGRAGLALEAADLLGVGERPGGQHLERHAAAERLLLGLVHDAHAAAAHLAQQAELAQPAGGRTDDRAGPAGERRVRSEVSPPRSSIIKSAGKSARISSASSGCSSAYSSGVTASPRRIRSRNSSDRTSTGLRSVPPAAMVDPFSLRDAPALAQRRVQAAFISRLCPGNPAATP